MSNAAAMESIALPEIQDQILCKYLSIQGERFMDELTQALHYLKFSQCTQANIFVTQWPQRIVNSTSNNLSLDENLWRLLNVPLKPLLSLQQSVSAPLFVDIISVDI